jgi:hypothetical protein
MAVYIHCSTPTSKIINSNESFQLILSSGFENRVNAYEIHSSLCDYSLKGRFIGHVSMVTAI